MPAIHCFICQRSTLVLALLTVGANLSTISTAQAIDWQVAILLEGVAATVEPGHVQDIPEVRSPRSSPPTEFPQPDSPSLFQGAVSGLSTTVERWLEQAEMAIAAGLSARPFPDIHPRARRARVPVIMYHDVLPEKEVFFDVTVEEFAADLEFIQDNGLTPISLDQLAQHLTSGTPLPEKPVVLTFDDGYAGHYEYVYPLLQEYGYPAAFGIYADKVERRYGRSTITWEQLREMAADPLVTIASHSFSHPDDLRGLEPEQLEQEIVESKRILEAELGVPIHHFVYPVGKYDEEVQRWVARAGYRTALTMNDQVDLLASESATLLSIERIGQSRLEQIALDAWGGPSVTPFGSGFNFDAPVRLNRVTLEDISLILISGGRPITIHADSRYQVPEIIAGTEAIAAVDGGFFSLRYLESNTMIGPVLSQNTREFVPGNASENPKLQNRPLVLITPDEVEFVPFDHIRHNTLAGIQAIHPDVTDAFVAAGWLVRDGEPQDLESFGDLFDVNEPRHRAFWGIDDTGQPVVGVSADRVGSVHLGQLLYQVGMWNAVMLDSGASTSLAYAGESLVQYEPRPVPHVVALVPPDTQVALQKSPF
jgi:peptidoglycan/xylan/chitin deacetylase (PgdA/CDA1 family)